MKRFSKYMSFKVEILRFNEVVSAMMDCFFPNKPNKPWMTSSLKSPLVSGKNHFMSTEDIHKRIDFGAIKFNEMLKWHVESTMQIPCRS